MSGVFWAGTAWFVLIVVWAWRDRRAGRDREWLNKENVALMLVFLGTVSIAGKTTAEEVLRDPVVVERAVRGGLAALSIAISGPVLVHRLRRPPPMRGYLALTVLTAYVAIAAVSALYSAAPLVTAAKVFELGAAFVAIAAAALAHDGRSRLRSMAHFAVALGAALLITAIIGFFVIPTDFSFVSPYRPGFLTALTMGAPFASANELSAIGALFATYALARLLQANRGRETAFWLAGMLFGIVGILLSSGRQGVIMLIAAVFTLLWFQRRTLFLTLIGPVSVAILWMNWESVFRSFSRGQPQLLSNLTGRLPWWEAALAAWAEHPWTGYGYGVGGRFVGLASIGKSSVSNVHSGYLEALVGVGLIGVLPLLIAIGFVASWSLGALRAGRDVSLAILIVPLMLHTSVDLGFGGWLKLDLILLAILAGLADWRRGEKRSTTSLEQPIRLS